MKQWQLLTLNKLVKLWLRYINRQIANGYISLEVSPDLCHDVEGTIKGALQLWNAVNEPNLMIKVPATAAGVQAFEKLVVLGLNVNITLLFNLAQVNAIWDAYIRGLETRAAQEFTR